MAERILIEKWADLVLSAHKLYLILVLPTSFDSLAVLLMPVVKLHGSFMTAIL